jgi:rhodanese-related sulfurtransferase
LQTNELIRRIQSNTAPVIVDPRSTLEFGRGHIPGAINAPIWKLVLNKATLPPDRNCEMVVACMHGQRAWLARKMLAMRGYRNMDFLDGWLEGWVKAGLPWERPASHD